MIRFRSLDFLSLVSLISGTNLAKAYGPQDVFRGVSVAIPHGARVALVGPNGAGKTTLLRLLAGVEEPSEGAVHRAKGLTLGYLPQEALLADSPSGGLAPERGLWEECLTAFEELRQREAELERLAHALSEAVRSEEVLEKYGRLQERFEREGGYFYESRIRQVLTGLGFQAQDFDRPVRQLSGGQKTRAQLARLLLRSPGLLVLDEPTNHLDIGAVEWLENYLNEWKGAALIVSHDRYFLDRVAQAVWELHGSGVEAFRGNYSAYQQQREERRQRRQELFEAEKERMEKELEYVRRNISGQNTLNAKGRLRRLSRQIQALEQGGIEAVHGKRWSEVARELEVSSRSIGVDEAARRLRALQPPGLHRSKLHLRLGAESRSGDRVIETEGLEVGYPDDRKVLFRAPKLLLLRGECAALIGPNGAGKTTFLKTLLGEIPPLAGKVRLGASLHVGYFAQAHEGLNQKNTVLQEVMQAGLEKPSQARNFLARFSFTGEDEIHKPIRVLSGGERGRVALAKLTLQGANLLLLDEPTNHLDIPSQETLEAALRGFPGTILLVSHDRYLIDRLATQIWEVLPDQSQLHVFPGTYREYVEARESEREKERGEAGGGLRSRQPEKSRSAASGEARRRSARAAKVEAEVAELERQLVETSQQLVAAGSDVVRVSELGEQYQAIGAELAGKLSEWETLARASG